VTVRVSVPVLPEGSYAVTVIMLSPDWRVIPVTDQEVVPVAVPEPPLLFTQVTLETLVLSEAVPDILMGELPIE
jgi:hypothetical protein